MKQNQYEAILNCIQFGAPALAQELIAAFNQVMENSNAYVTIKMQEEQAARKAAEEEARKAQEKVAQEKAAKEANLSLNKATKK